MPHTYTYTFMHMHTHIHINVDTCTSMQPHIHTYTWLLLLVLQCGERVHLSSHPHSAFKAICLSTLGWSLSDLVLIQTWTQSLRTHRTNCLELSMAAGPKACLEYLEDRTACLLEALAKVNGQGKADECWHWGLGLGCWACTQQSSLQTRLIVE